jgi:site-specific DNA recombinase
VPERYDDGGFSGGDMNRPALERLLTDIRAGAVDCVVVYKVDRLCRSLLDFAQFEREIIAERTRDKMSAARRKGKWTGGHPLPGYDIDPRGRRLILNMGESHQVRTIYSLYLDHRALRPVMNEVDRRGWRTKQWVTRKGETRGGKPFTKGLLYRLLTNVTYTGKVEYKGHIYGGERGAVVDGETWECARDPPAQRPSCPENGVNISSAKLTLLGVPP